MRLTAQRNTAGEEGKRKREIERARTSLRGKKNGVKALDENVKIPARCTDLRLVLGKVYCKLYHKLKLIDVV